MGTRNLTLVFLNGNYAVAQYGQWDGYPGGQGLTVLGFARDQLDRPKFEAKLRALREVTEEDRGRVNQTTNWSAVYPQLSRDAGGTILKMVQDGDDGMLIVREVGFAADSLMCEWAYVLDLDKNTLEVFEGFNKSKLAGFERFAFLADKAEGDYAPIKFVASWPLDGLPSDNEFVAKLEAADDEDEAA